MNTSESLLEIQTLGCFKMSIDGRPVATDWPNETLKVLFCSLFSPLDLYITWERLCRSIWDIPATDLSRERLNELFVHPLNDYLIQELGYNPLIAGIEGVRIDQRRIRLDSYEFYIAAVEGFRLFSLGNNAAAFELFSHAKLLFSGTYLPGCNSKIINSTRTDLQSLYKTAVLNAMPLSRRSVWQGSERRAHPDLYVMSTRRSLHEVDCHHEVSL